MFYVQILFVPVILSYPLLEDKVIDLIKNIFF